MISAYKIKAKSHQGLWQAGFTLIEAMLVVMLLIIVVSAIIPFIFGAKQSGLSSQESPDQQNVFILKSALNLYKLDNGFYPTTEQGLDALVKKPDSSPIPQHWIPYLSKLPVDQFGQAFHYTHNEETEKISIFTCAPVQAKQPWWYSFTHFFSKQTCADKQLYS